MNRKLSIVVVSYDGYSDMWNDFFALKKKNWNDCPYPTYLSNNNKPFDFDEVTTINCGTHAQWSDRARVAIEQISSKYVCLMVEDFFISDVVDTKQIEEVLTFMEDQELNYYKLQTMTKIKTPCFKDIHYLRTIPSNLRYGVSLTTAIWNREYILSLIGSESYNPWKFEIKMVKQAEEAITPYRNMGVFDERNLLHICHMVVQGKFIPRSLKEMKDKGFIVNTSGRNTLSPVEVIKKGIKDIGYPLAQRMPWLRTIGQWIGIESLQKREG